MTSASDDFDTQLRVAFAEPISGWHFPFLKERRRIQKLEWDYPAIARDLVSNAERILDHGTGGGEILAQIGTGRDFTVATEAHAPNVGVAARTLAPLGVQVVHVESGTFDTRGPDSEHLSRRMPFSDSVFDVVLARHVAFSSAEIYRILRPGGTLLTQMGRVGPRRAGEISIHDYFPGTTGPSWPHWQLTEHLTAAGFQIDEYREQFQRNEFLDIAAVAYFLRTVPWVIPDFTAELYRDQLRQLYDHISTHGSLVTANTALMARATKPDG